MVLKWRGTQGEGGRWGGMSLADSWTFRLGIEHMISAIH